MAPLPPSFIFALKVLSLYQTTLEKERVSLTESRSALEKLQAEQAVLITQNGELKTEVETLQFKLQQVNQGVRVDSNPTDTGYWSKTWSDL